MLQDEELRPALLVGSDGLPIGDINTPPPSPEPSESETEEEDNVQACPNDEKSAVSESSSTDDESELEYTSFLDLKDLMRLRQLARMNKLALNKNLLKALARIDVPPQLARPTVHEAYLNDQTTIQRFHRHLPIGPIYGKWKNGIPLWPSVKSSFVPYRCQESLALDVIIENLLRGNIIKPAQRGPFVSNIFLVQKSNGQSRPIVDFSHLTPHLKVPKMVLPSLNQLVRKKTWSKNLWYAKFDFASAFFNVDLKEVSKYITCFKYRDKYYVFNRLSMGLSIAPFVMQRFTNIIVRYIRQFTTMTWGHIDDVLVAHEDPEYLKEIVNKCLNMFEKIGWRLNLTKSVLNPVKSITFLRCPNDHITI